LTHRRAAVDYRDRHWRSDIPVARTDVPRIGVQTKPVPTRAAAPRAAGHRRRGVRGHDEILESLNQGLTLELTAINQYFCQARMCDNWGYHTLGKKHYEESMGEMKHADRLIQRILFLEGTPEIARYDVIRVGADVKEQLEHDLKLELGAVQHYNAGIEIAARLKDGGTRELFESILTDSEEHVNWLETQLRLIDQIGLENFLVEQM
jgi:bacterioferritin